MTTGPIDRDDVLPHVDVSAAAAAGYNLFAMLVAMAAAHLRATLVEDERAYVREADGALVIYVGLELPDGSRRRLEHAIPASQWGWRERN
jgi:hypothetical protein